MAITNHVSWPPNELGNHATQRNPEDMSNLIARNRQVITYNWCTPAVETSAATWLTQLRARFLSLARSELTCARPITGQVTSVTCPVIGWLQSEHTLSKRQKMGPDLVHFWTSFRRVNNVHVLGIDRHLGAFQNSNSNKDIAKQFHKLVKYQILSYAYRVIYTEWLLPNRILQSFLC